MSSIAPVWLTAMDKTFSVTSFGLYVESDTTTALRAADSGERGCEFLVVSCPDVLAIESPQANAAIGWNVCPTMNTIHEQPYMVIPCDD